MLLIQVKRVVETLKINLTKHQVLTRILGATTPVFLVMHTSRVVMIMMVIVRVSIFMPPTGFTVEYIEVQTE